ncbi:MAG: EF-hand domain-containing protein [Planctomycetales bacterium]|nr:EF-hand domain-containing protein [Planctomycetales bacterium]
MTHRPTRTALAAVAAALLFPAFPATLALAAPPEVQPEKPDVAPDAKPEKPEVRPFRGKLGQGPGQRELPEAVLERFDANGNGQLDPPERARMLEAIRRRGAGPDGAGKPNGAGKPKGAGKPNGPGKPNGFDIDRLPPEVKQRILERLDKNGDGKLDPEELAPLRERMGGRNRGGQGLQQGGPRRPTLDQAALLKKYDANGNGQLDPDERAKAARELRSRRDKS